MASVKTAISLERPLLTRIDAVANELHVPRSRLLARAAEEFLERHENARLLAQLTEAYSGDADDPSETEVRRHHRRRHRRRLEDEAQRVLDGLYLVLEPREPPGVL